MPPLKLNRSGLIYATCAFGFWGLLPIYFKAVAAASPWEVLAHRVFWSAVLTAGMLTWDHSWHQLWSQLRARRAQLTLVATGILITCNWLVTIYAVTSSQILSLSLGYYINPLFNVLLGFFFLGERLSRAQWFAVALAAAGTANLTLAWALPAWAEKLALVTIRLKRGIYHVSAVIYLDGRSLNQGRPIVKSVTVRMPPGRHKVKVTKARYLYRTRYMRLLDKSQSFAVQAGQEKRVVIWWPGVRLRQSKAGCVAGCAQASM